MLGCGRRGTWSGNARARALTCAYTAEALRLRREMASRTVFRSSSVQWLRRRALQLTHHTRQLSGSSRRLGSSETGITWSTLNRSVLPQHSQNGDCLRSRMDRVRQRLSL